jgi:hypothetical protein
MSTARRRTLGLTVLITLCIAGRVSADLKSDAYDRFYNRYVGKWKANVAKSRYIVDGPPKEAPSHTYGEIPGRKGIQYNGGAIHLLDGKDHPLSPDRPGSTVTREVLDEFTIVTTIKQNGRVTSRNTFVVSPDGKFGAFVVMNIDEKGEPLIRSLVYYDKQ